MKRFGFVFFILIFTAAGSHAADWQFYGSARVQAFFAKDDYGQFPFPARTYYTQYLQNNARLGARISVNEQLSARFEYGQDVNVRVLYGEWHFGAGSLLVGQAYSPLNINYSSQVFWDDTNLTDIGGVYSSRNPMIRLTFGGFQIAVLEPDTPGISGVSTTENKLPKLEARYRVRGNQWDFQVAGGYHSYDVIDGPAEYGINSYVLAMGGSIRPGKALLAATVWMGQNTGGYRMENLSDDLPTLDTAAGSVYDNDGYGYTLIAGYTDNDMLYLEAGYGYIQADSEDPGKAVDQMHSYYAQSRITLAPGVFVVPEIGLINWGKFQNKDMGETTYYGAKWQIDF
jgi:hypothetical protein